MRLLRMAGLIVALALSIFVARGDGAASVDIDCSSWDPFTPELAAELESQFPNRNITAAVTDLDLGCDFDIRPGQVQSTASVIKITIMAGILLRAQDQGRELTDSERSLTSRMMAESDDPSASTLWTGLGGASGVQETAARFGLEDTILVEPKWGASLTTGQDQVDLLRQVLLGGGPLQYQGTVEARAFMEAVVPSQRWGATVGLPDSWPVPMKNGFFDSIMWDWRINTVGFVDPPSRQGYLLAVLTDGWPDEASGIEGVEIVALSINNRLNRSAPPAHPFIDVAEGAHYEEALSEFVADGIIEGVSPVFFDPAGDLTRAQFASILFRQAGSPEFGESSTGFSDVGASSPHAQAISWLVAEGITFGTSGTTFDPGGNISRAQVAAMLFRQAGSPQSSGTTPFTDVPATAYFHEAVAWMADEGITLGLTESFYGAAEMLSRGQAVSMVARANG